MSAINICFSPVSTFLLMAEISETFLIVDFSSYPWYNSVLYICETGICLRLRMEHILMGLVEELVTEMSWF